MVYNIINATKYKRLFTQKNIHRKQLQKEISEIKMNDIKDAKIVSRFNYYTKSKNWIDIETGEIFITDEKIKKFPEDVHLTKNLRALQKFFRDNQIKIHQKFPLDFGEQLPIF